MVNAAIAKEEHRIREHTRQLTLDWVVIALGRMGWGEKRLRDFNEMLSAVMDEYSRLICDDVKDDSGIEYSKYKLDEELKQYCGALFAPYEERY